METDRQLPPLAAALRDAVNVALGGGETLGGEANPALVFERYPRVWESRHGTWDLGLGRKQFLTDFVAGYRRLGSTYPTLVEERRRALDVALGDGRDFTSRWRFVSGLGADHPLENGFTFHRLFGVPYLPGSSVKGMTRAAAKAFGIDQWEEDEIFGPALAPGVRARAGSLVFGDALPVGWPRLGVDLVNNHHPTWTARLGGGSLDGATRASAAGMEDPVPVFFLVVEPGATFRFWLAPRPGSQAGEEMLARAWQWLEAGLHYLGIGAKTAVGYGRFGSGAAPSTSASAGSGSEPAALPEKPRYKTGDRVRFVLTGTSKKGKWQGHLADDPTSFGTLLGNPPGDAAIGREYEVIVGVAADLRNLNLRWP